MGGSTGSEGWREQRRERGTDRRREGGREGGRKVGRVLIITCLTRLSLGWECISHGRDL